MLYLIITNIGCIFIFFYPWIHRFTGIHFILWNCYTFIHSEIVLRIARIISKQRRINNIIRSQFMPSVAGNMNLVSNFKRNLFSMQGFQRNLYALCTPIHFVNVPPDTICLSEYLWSLHFYIFYVPEICPAFHKKQYA